MTYHPDAPRRPLLLASVLVLWLLAIVTGLKLAGLPDDFHMPGLDPKACGRLVWDTGGLLPLEFSGNEDCDKAIKDAWGQPRFEQIDGQTKPKPTRVHEATRAVYWDFLFIPLYVAALLALALWVGLRTHRPYWTPLLFGAAGAIILAGLLDTVENFGLLRVLAGWRGPSAGVTFGLAAAKFALANAAILTVACAWIGVESEASDFVARSHDYHKQAAAAVPSQTPPPARSRKQRFLRGLTYIWPLRVIILAGAFLVGFPLLMRSPDIERYISGIFDPVEAAAMGPIALLALLCAWTLAIMGRLIVTYGHARLGLPELLAPGNPVPGRMWSWFALLAVPIISAVIRQSACVSSRSVKAMVLYASFGVITACMSLAISLHFANRLSKRRASPYVPYQKVLDWVQAHPFFGLGFVSTTRPAFLLPGHGIALFLGVASLAVYAYVGWDTRQVTRPVLASTMAYVLLLTLVLSWMYGLAAFFFDRTRVPLFIYLIGWTLLVNVVYDRLLGFSTDLEYETYDIRTPGEAKRSQDPETPPPIEYSVLRETPIIVAASGGGIQAAAWTTKVLTELSGQFENFDDRIQLLSAVSGGSVGVMHYLTQRPACGPPMDADLPPPTREEALRQSMESSLHAAGWGLVYQDLPRTIAPFLTYATVNRGSKLEDAWKRDRRVGAWVDRKQPRASPALLSNWEAQVAAEKCPGAVFNAMVAETGEPMLFSTAALPESLRRFEFRRHYPGLDVKLATAVRLSAAFPYVSPAARAQHDSVKDFERPKARGVGKEFRYNHIVDGGYFDNFGVATAAEWLHGQLRLPKKNDRKSKATTRVLLLEICEEGTCSTTPASEQPAHGGPRKTLVYQAYAPLSALFQMRSAAQRARNRWHVSLLRETWIDDRVTVMTARFAFPKEAGPMSWHLTGNQKKAIDAAWNDEAIVRQRHTVGCFLGVQYPECWLSTRAGS